MYHEIETPKIFFIFHETGLILQNSTCPFRKLKRTDSEKVSYTSSNKPENQLRKSTQSSLLSFSVFTTAKHRKLWVQVLLNLKWKTSSDL